MNILGWIFIIVSWAIIIFLVIFSFNKVFKNSKQNIVPPLEIDTEIDSKKKRITGKKKQRK